MTTKGELMEDGIAELPETPASRLAFVVALMSVPVMDGDVFVGYESLISRETALAFLEVA